MSTPAAPVDIVPVFRELIDVSPVAALVVQSDASHRILYMSRRFTEVFGYTLKDVWDVASWWPRAYPDPDYRRGIQELWEAALQEAARSGRNSIRPVEARITCKDGSSRWMEVHMGMAGEQALVLFNDLESRKESEDLLRRSEQTAHLTNLIRSTLLNSDGEEMFADVLELLLKRFRSRFGFFGYVRERDGALVCPSMTRDSWIQSMVTTKNIEFPRAAWGGLWGRVLTERRPLLKNDLHRTPDGHVPLHRSMGAPLVAGGQLVGSIHLANAESDYSEADLACLAECCDVLAQPLQLWLRKQAAEEARAQASDRLEGIIDSAMDAVITADEQGRITIFNRAAEQLFRLPAKEALGSPLDRFIPPLHRGAHADHLKTFTANVQHPRRMSPRAPVQALRADGTEFPAEASISHASIDGRSFSTAILRDVSERMDAERRQAGLEQQLRQVQKLESLGQLAGGVAHDFNNLLQVINGFAELCASQLPDLHPARAGLAQITKAGAHAAGITRQLLTFGRRSAREARPLDLNAAVEETLPMLRRLAGEGVSLTFKPLHRLPIIMEDPTLLNQVLVNLCVNARDAMPRGGRIFLETDLAQLNAEDEARLDVPSGRYVRLSIADTGTGIPRDIVSRIFEPFFTTKGPGQGSGLGLSVVHGIVRQSGGAIDLLSAPGEGTVFVLYFPALDVLAQAHAAPPAVPAAGAGSMLVVDDDDTVREFLGMALRSLGHEVLAAASGAEALDLMERRGREVSLLITDVRMPGMDGPMLAERLKSRFPDLGVIYISGNSAHYENLQPLLSKPFTVGGLAELIRKLRPPGGRGAGRRT